MRKTIFLAIALALFNYMKVAGEQTIRDVGTTFSPNSITVKVGEKVKFDIESEHNAVEVTKATWDANGSSAKTGGFRVPFGGGELVFSTPGTYYYVCEPHASAGMKGVIIVEAPTAVTSLSENLSSLILFPNPASEFITLSYELQSRSAVNIRLINFAGVEVFNVFKGSQEPGQYENIYYLDKRLIPGVYLISIDLNNEQYFKQILLE